MNEFTIDYSPLMYTLFKRDISLTEMGNDLGISSRTLAKIKKKESMSLSTIGKICSYLNVTIEEVVNIKISN